MADYYYADLLFNPEVAPIDDVVVGSAEALLESGCEFREIMVPSQKFSPLIKWGEYTTAGLDRLREMCVAVVNEGLSEGRDVISFPPSWGRIMFEYPFAFDEEIKDEIWDEEEETNALSTDIGLSFAYSQSKYSAPYIKLTLCFWEDFVLSHGAPATHIANLNRVFGFWENIVRRLSPYFGVMNAELHINADKSLELLKEGKLPEGNEYVLVGKKAVGLLGAQVLAASGRPYRQLADGSLLIEFTDRWSPASALK